MLNLKYAAIIEPQCMIRSMRAKIKKLAEKHDLSLVLLFGSKARGNTHPRSDTDLGFLAEKTLTPREVAEMQFAFSQELKDGQVELVDMKNAPPLLLRRAAEEGVLLFEKEPLVFSRFKVYAFKRHMEAKPLLNLRKLSLKKFLQKA